MADKVSMCNMALGHCKAGTIEDIDEQSNEAIQCKLFYDDALKVLFEDHSWKFIRRVKALDLLAEEPKKWIYSYSYPTDCVVIDRLLPDIDLTSGNGNEVLYRNEYYNINYEYLKNYKVPYEVALNTDGNQAIWTNEANAYIQYRIDQTDVNMYPSLFRLAFSHYLASLIAVPVTGHKIGRVIASDNLELYQATINKAIGNDYIEMYKGKKPESDMIRVRFES